MTIRQTIRTRIPPPAWGLSLKTSDEQIQLRITSKALIPETPQSSFIHSYKTPKTFFNITYIGGY
ncbi:MAG: hypothetical protein BWY21_01263 [Parcubacteria group bacterium ADurb.Bin216]|nr:MAG: hypothetical protein BWY21_01263 [Parcubacteria group bacterium ADurb.Bin216]